jgi:hypothetical protein
MTHRHLRGPVIVVLGTMELIREADGRRGQGYDG